MDVVGLLVSLNKISLVALVITFGFVFYQVYQLRKETENKKKKLVIPEFKEGTGSSFATETKIVSSQEKKTYMKSSIIPIIVGIILFFLFGGIFVFGFLNPASKQRAVQTPSPTPVINFVASKGIKFYNQNWKPLSDADAGKLNPGDQVIIGIETVSGTDTDMARIRVNSSDWNPNDITIDFNNQFNVFFKDHIIATGESRLRITAELHSKADGWLGE